MKDFFYAIQDLFVDYIFAPFDWLRKLELESWFGANTISWLFMLIGFVAMIYWMLQLRIFDNNNEEDKSISSHSFL
ncbi:uracil phosphoribosyltransferase [Algibacter marinivivus]|uniref:Uracil phosphoribosyltransferase n=1 Tax=Algibacter marinivivus TaxID=2100723 RepID=A0A2U2X7V7_9FLAO|nr:uracil phosphoribosyltransferase [Algibacter marinivivus]PWH83868.1 uracil phosphoribosyltransferase [Algibacter marinivivus]